MRFPKRVDSHVMETKSWALLTSLAPDTWIPREVTERDYGIDAYIEIATEAGDVTGNLISAQLKAVDSIADWSTGDSQGARSPSIDTSTAAYWLHLPIPVFLFVADLSAKEIYYVSVESPIRRSFDKLSTQRTRSFRLDRELRIGSDFGNSMLNILVALERQHDSFVQHAINLLSQLSAVDQFIMSNQMRDGFMEVEVDRQLHFQSIYQTLRAVANQLIEPWPVESLADLYKMDRDQWNDPSILMHENVLDHALAKLEPLLPSLARKVINLVAREQPAYWRSRAPILHRACTSMELEWLLKPIEARVMARESRPRRGRG